MPFSALLRAAAFSASVLFLSEQGAHAVPELRREGVFSIGIPSADMSEPRAEEALMPPAPAEVDVQLVWSLGAEGRWKEASASLRALTKSHQGWQAPASLRAYLAEGQRELDVREALAAHDWTRVLALLPPSPDDGCEPPFELWARADALHGLADQHQVLNFYVRVLTNCSDPGLVSALTLRASDALDADGLSEIIRIPGLATSESLEVARAYKAVIKANVWLRFQTAQGAGDIAAAAMLAEQSDDVRLLVQAGWMFLEADPSRAAGFFRRATVHDGGSDAWRGLSMAALAIGDHAGARSAIAQAGDVEDYKGFLARVDLDEARQLRQRGDWLLSAELADRAARLDPALTDDAEITSGGALLDASAMAYDLGDFETAGMLARKARGYRAAQRAAEMRIGWIDLQAGQAERAAATFSRLYLAAPDAESAEGFALAAQKAGKLDSAAAIARAVGGPLAEKVDAQYASAAFYQGDYLTAKALAPNTYEALEGVDHTLYRQTLSVRQQDGTRGENRMTGYASTTSVEVMRGASRYEAGLTLYRIDTGEAGGAGRETFAAPMLGWSREGKTSLAARVGLIPVGGGADPAIAGEAAAMRRFGKHSGEARVFVRPRTDSLLAFAGDTRPNAALSGRVMEMGARVLGRLDIGGGRALQADLSAAQFDGQNTDSNAMVSAGFSASQSIAASGFDYLVTGPFYQYQSYDQNTNFFSAGHGGYFSPQQFHRAGWSLNARTEPLKDWIVKLDGAMAFESVREEAAREFPLLSEPGALIGGGTSSGAAGSLDLAMARRIGPEVIVSANIAVTASKAFEDLRAGIGIVWVPGGRAALVPSDLATDPFSPGSWIRP